MARSLLRPRLVRIAVAAILAAGATAAAARAVLHRPRIAREHPAASCHRAGADVAWSAFAARVYDEVEGRARKLGVPSRTRVARTILEETARVQLDPRIVLAVIQVESAYDPRVESGAGAVGLMQLLRPTMREEAARSRLGSADPHDPVANVRAGIRYLSRLAASFDDVELALLAYNAGPARIRGHLRAGAIPERLRVYPRRVQAELDRIATRWGQAPLRLSARVPRPPIVLAAHSPPARGIDDDASPSLRPGRGHAPEASAETPGLALASSRFGRRAAARTAVRRRRARRAARRCVAVARRQGAIRWAAAARTWSPPPAST